MRIFLPSASALCDAERLDQLASHTVSPTINGFHDFINMMTLSPTGDSDSRSLDAAYCWQGLVLSPAAWFGVTPPEVRQRAKTLLVLR
jgi:hypothetical protein